MKLEKSYLSDRAAGVLVASAAGDALGAGYEFAGLVEPQSADMIGGGLGDFEPGEWTDDTSMSNAVSMVAAKGYFLEKEESLDKVSENFMAWYRSDPPDMGIQTRGLLSSSEASASSLRNNAEKFFKMHPNNAAGNGSLMRTGVVALTALGDDKLIYERAKAVSLLTHGDPLTWEACVLWSIAIDRAVRESRVDGVYDGLKLLPPERRNYWEEKIQEVKDAPKEHFNPNGFVVSAFQAALSAVWSTTYCDARALEEGLRNAVSIGNDTDTVAAIAGMLLGGRWGASAVPLRWRRMLHGWPGLRVRDLTHMGILAFHGGQTDATGWPLTTSLRRYYDELWRPEPYVLEVESAPGLKIGNYPALSLAASQSDTTVSLCRIGKDDVRGINHHEVWLLDSDLEDDNLNLRFVIDDTASFIADEVRKGRSVFLHCVMGASRTPTVAAKVVSLLNGTDAQEELVKLEKRIPVSTVKPALRAALM